jgi:hypothetical protein
VGQQHDPEQASAPEPLDEGAAMDIHKPKPIHSWRELASEIVVIVIGILIAIGLEQAVEWYHWRGEVAETEEAIHEELDFNLWSVLYSQSGDACADKRIALLHDWADGKTRIDSSHLAHWRNRQSLWSLRFVDWEVAKSGATASHLPLRKRLDYARLYSTIELLQSQTGLEAADWLALGRYQGKGVLSPDEARRLQEDLGAIEAAASTRRRNGVLLIGRLRASGATPRAPSGVTISNPNQLCAMPS